MRAGHRHLTDHRVPAATVTTTVAAQILRDFRRTPQLVATTVGQGILFLLVFRFVFGGAITTAEPRYVDYLTPGIVTAGILFAAATTAVGAAQDRASGLTEHLATLPASRLGLVLGRVVADTVVIVSTVAAMLAVAVLVGFRPEAGAGSLAAAAALVVLYAVAAGALFGALGTVAATPQAAQGLGFLAVPFTFVSSAYVPTDAMPGVLAAVARHQPVTTMIEGLRHLTFPGSGASPDHVGRALAIGVLVAALSVALTLRVGYRPSR